jgi:hypothetical protein
VGYSHDLPSQIKCCLRGREDRSSFGGRTLKRNLSTRSHQPNLLRTIDHDQCIRIQTRKKCTTVPSTTTLSTADGLATRSKFQAPLPAHPPPHHRVAGAAVRSRLPRPAIHAAGDAHEGAASHPERPLYPPGPRARLERLRTTCTSPIPDHPAPATTNRLPLCLALPSKAGRSALRGSPS